MATTALSASEAEVEGHRDSRRLLEAREVEAELTQGTTTSLFLLSVKRLTTKSARVELPAQGVRGMLEPPVSSATEQRIVPDRMAVSVLELSWDVMAGAAQGTVLVRLEELLLGFPVVQLRLMLAEPLGAVPAAGSLGGLAEEEQLDRTVLAEPVEPRPGRMVTTPVLEAEGMVADPVEALRYQRR
jgi:hypothetical protein